MINASRPTILAAILATALAAPAFAQQSKNQQGCINAINKDAAQVGKAQGKENAKCVKNGTKDSVAVNCPTADLKQKVAKKIAKAAEDEAARCSELPDFAYTSGIMAADAYRAEELNLLSDTYGTTNLDGPISSDKVIGKCQYGVTKNLEKVAVAAAMSFVKCKKDQLKNPVVSAADVQDCVSAGTLGHVANAAAKLSADTATRCAAVTIATAFPGVCSASTPATLGTCLANRAKCRMCRAANGADALNADCDNIDDGVANASCS